ncbi:MAG: molybdopterin-binding protein, partial [Clostridia bacterium]|nr:molybdopterin-binding protein [Clostridia bacterium]
MYKTAIITASDQGAVGRREDQSGQVIEDFLAQMKEFEFLERRVLPDDLNLLAENLRELSQKANLILTTGGTGFS